jgi:hypothetical protein
MLTMRNLSFAAMFAVATAGGCASDPSDPPPDDPGVPHVGEATCSHDLCATGPAVDPACHLCAGHVCAADPFCCSTTWDAICVLEVETVCGETCPVSCGDGICSAAEDCSSCSADCGACASCGNGTCEWGEDCASCASDCGACPTCSHDKCATGAPLSASCDACTADICAADPFCCSAAWDVLCVAEVSSICGETCGTPGCGDGTCGLLEDCASCPADCGTCPPPTCTAFGTDTFGYTGCVGTVSAVPECEDISATGTLGCSGDDCTATVTLPFSFDFYGTAATTLGFISNGKLGFPGAIAYANSCTIETNTIAAFWDDLYPPGGGSLRYQTFGTAPNRHVTFQWNVPIFGGSSSYDIRAVLYEGTNDIDLCYVDTVAGSAANDLGASATAGIKGTTSGLSYSCNMPLLTSGTLLRFTHPGGPSSCGDGVCSFLESCSSCPADCGACGPFCGDATCDATEDCATCPADCGTCPPPAACGDGIDNDSDGLTDFPDDPGCATATDTDETDPAPGCTVFGSDTFGYSGCVDAAPALLPCEDVSTTGTLGCSSDDCSTSVALPFTFDFYGTGQTSVGFVSNGKLGFPGTTTYSNTCTIEANTIAAFWDDLYPPMGGSLRYQTFGTAPDRHTTFQWTVPHISGGTPLDVRAVLYEATSDIDLCYVDVDLGSATVDFGASATVGIHGAAGAGSINYSCNTPSLSAGMLVHFEHP